MRDQDQKRELMLAIDSLTKEVDAIRSLYGIYARTDDWSREYDLKRAINGMARDLEETIRDIQYKTL